MSGPPSPHRPGGTEPRRTPRLRRTLVSARSAAADAGREELLVESVRALWSAEEESADRYTSLLRIYVTLATFLLGAIVIQISTTLWQGAGDGLTVVTFAALSFLAGGAATIRGPLPQFRLLFPLALLARVGFELRLPEPSPGVFSGAIGGLLLLGAAWLTFGLSAVLIRTGETSDRDLSEYRPASQAFLPSENDVEWAEASMREIPRQRFLMWHDAAVSLYVRNARRRTRVQKCRQAVRNVVVLVVPTLMLVALRGLSDTL